MKKLIRFLPHLLAVLFFGAIFAFYLSWPSNRVIAQWHKPDTIQYNSFDPYTLSVIEGSRKLNTLGWPRRHYIFIGRTDDAPSYGYYHDYSFHAGYEHVDDYIAKAKVDWTAEGVTLTESDGQSLFLPKKLFIGGR